MRGEDRELPPGETEGRSPGEGRAKLPHILPGEEIVFFRLFFFYNPCLSIVCKDNFALLFRGKQETSYTRLPAAPDRQVPVEGFGALARGDNVERFEN